ncbi:MAG: magnesium transporter [Aureliella sp.]
MNKTTEEQSVELDSQIRELLGRSASQELNQLLSSQDAGDLARAVSFLDEGSRKELVEQLDTESAADLLEQLPHVQAFQLIEEAEPAQAAAILDELPSDLQADFIGEFDTEDAEQVLAAMAPHEAADARRLGSYDPNSAGGLMVAEFLQFPIAWTIGQVVQDLQERAAEYRDYEIQYAYVVEASGKLGGVLRLRDLLIEDRELPLSEIMIPEPLSVAADEPLESLHGFFLQHHFIGVPVVDIGGRLIGVLQRTDVDQAWIEQQDKSFLKRQGIVSGEEIRSLPLGVRSRGRLMWLSLNVVLNLLAAAIISHFEGTLATAIALTAFLPIISDMSGCSGNQAVAVSIRELMLGLVKPSDVFHVWRKEIAVGLINGVCVGTLLGCIAWIWKGSPVLGAVVGVALMFNTMVAVSIGGVVPLFLRSIGRDPAVASGPLLTTITDMCGFFLVLSLASTFIEYL